MRSTLLLGLAAVLGLAALLQAKPFPPDKKEEPAPAFKPIDIKNELDADDPKDEKLQFPSRKFTVKLAKDRTYVIDMDSKDFDTYLRLLNKKGKQLAEDDDGGGELNSRIFYAPTENGDHTIVATTFDGQVGKFNLRVRELNLKGEAKARALGNDGALTVNGELGENDKTDLDKLSKAHTVQLKGGQSYLFEIKSEDFDPQVYVFDSKGKLLGQDPEKVACAASADGLHHIVVKSFDGQTGKFELKLRSFTLKGEAKARDVKNALKIEGKITNDDKTPLDKLGKIFSVELKAGQTYQIDLEGKDLSAYLYLFDSKSAMLAQDDGSVDPASRVIFEAPRDGVYHILATTLDGQETGDFTLAVRKK